MPQAGFKVVGQDTVGSVVGKELAQTSLWAFGAGGARASFFT